MSPTTRSARYRSSAPRGGCRPPLASIERAAPKLGEHNDYVLGELLGLSAEQRGSGWWRRRSFTNCVEEMIWRSKPKISSRKAKEFIEYKKDKKTKIAYLTLNRPDQYNATTVGMRLLYGDLIHRANIDDDVKVLVIRGAGDHFGTGGDLDEQNDAYTEGADVSLLHEFEIDDPDVQVPDEGCVPLYPWAVRALYEGERRLPQPAGVQEDQHRRGQGLLLRLALLSDR